MTLDQSFMNAKNISPIQNFNLDVHELSHARSGDPRFMAEVQKWHIDKYSTLIQKLKNSPEGAGTALDNTALVFYLEKHLA